jgi:hypothetical protein
VGDRGVGGCGGGFVGELVGWCVGGTSEGWVEYISGGVRDCTLKWGKSLLEVKVRPEVWFCDHCTAS